MSQAGSFSSSGGGGNVRNGQVQAFGGQTIDLLTVQSNMIFTTDNRSFIVTNLTTRIVDLQGFPESSIVSTGGFNSPDFDNIFSFSGVFPTSIDSTTTYTTQALNGLGTVVPPNTSLFINIVSTASDPTVYTAQVYFLGFYI